MAHDQHPNSISGSTTTSTTTSPVESATPEELHKKERKCSRRNPLMKWFKDSRAAATSDENSTRSASKSTGSSNSKTKPPVVVNYFPTAGRPGLL